MKHVFPTPLSVTAEKPFDSGNNDDRELRALGYKPSFKREFTNLATVSLPKYSRGLWRSLDDFFPRLALRLVSWYEIIWWRGCIYILNTMNRACARALQLHSTPHFSLEALHQWVLHINKHEHHLIHWLRWCGAGFLELRCASRLALALRRLSAHIQRVVDCKLSKPLHPTILGG